MAKIPNWMKQFDAPSRDMLLAAAKETAAWLESFGHVEPALDGVHLTEHWDPMPGKEVSPGELLLSPTSLYGGAAGIAFFYLRLFQASGERDYLLKAEAGVRYCMEAYRGIQDFRSDSPYLAGAYMGFMNGPAGGAYVAGLLYQATGDAAYLDFAKQVAEDAIAAAKKEDGGITWYGFYGILGEGGLILFFLNLYDITGEDKFLAAAKAASAYIDAKKEIAPKGGFRWYVMDTGTFPTIRRPGGYFPGFEYGAAGCGYIFASLYERTKSEEALAVAEGAAEYILSLARFSEDGKAALIPYNDTYLTDLYYLGVCQGPIGTSRLFFKMYQATGKKDYLDFVVALTNGLLAAGAPLKHSPGYWRTNCYCCGAAGMIEHFVNVHKLTGDEAYRKAAYDAAAALLGESTVQEDGKRNWYTAWNRHEPWTSDAYTGLYHGSAGCAAALLVLVAYEESGKGLAGYLEDPYKILFEKI